MSTAVALGEEPTQEPTEKTSEPEAPKEPEEPEVITARDNEDFAALLTLGDNCDGPVKTFANTYAGRRVQLAVRS